MRALLIASLAALAACATPSAPRPEGGWRLQTEATPPPTLRFENDGVAGFAGCNRWFGTLTAYRGLRITQVGATRMACPEPQMTTERDFLSMLDGAYIGDAQEDVLLLEDDQGNILARFTRDDSVR